MILSGLLWVLLTSLGLMATFLPRKWEMLLGPLLGRLAYFLDPKRRAIASENMRRCLPELDEAARSRLLKENYSHYGILILEFLHIFSPVPGHWKRYASALIRLEGLEHWERVRDKGVLFVATHLCNWEIGAAAGALAGMPLTIVTRTVRPPWLFKKLEAQRESTGLKAAYLPNTIQPVLKALRAREAVVFAMDQYAHPPNGIPAEFFGTRVDTLAAIGVFAQRYGAAILSVRQLRQKDGSIRVIIEDEPKGQGPDRTTAETTQAITTLIEGWIRQAPAQWLWVHRRFKNLGNGVSTRSKPAELSNNSSLPSATS